MLHDGRHEGVFAVRDGIGFRLDTAYWNMNNAESLAHWMATHWTIEDVAIKKNTIFMDCIPWFIDEWINYNPSYHAAVDLVDTSGLLPPFSKIDFKKNLVYNHSKMVINIENLEHFPGVRSEKNLFYSAGNLEAVNCTALLPIPFLQKNYPTHWAGSLWAQDPLFDNLTPTVTIDGSYRLLDFSDPAYTRFDDDFHLRPGSPAWIVGAGAYLD